MYFSVVEIDSKKPIRAYKTKIQNYAVERAEAAESIGFERTDKCLVGDDGYAYNGYWTIAKGSQA